MAGAAHSQEECVLRRRGKNARGCSWSVFPVSVQGEETCLDVFWWLVMTRRIVPRGVCCCCCVQAIRIKFCPDKQISKNISTTTVRNMHLSFQCFFSFVAHTTSTTRIPCFCRCGVREPVTEGVEEPHTHYPSNTDNIPHGMWLNSPICPVQTPPFGPGSQRRDNALPFAITEEERTGGLGSGFRLHDHQESSMTLAAVTRSFAARSSGKTQAAPLK
jgi:hypothetical protein